MKQSNNETMGGRFETQYPLNAREKEIKQILQYVTRGQSCQLISVPGAGRSTVLRLLAYHEKLRQHHLASQGDALRSKNNSNFLFIYLNFAEMPSFETAELTKALFLAILAAIREHGEQQEPWTTMGKEIYAIFKEALSLNDATVLFEYLKKAIQQFNPSTHSPPAGGSGQAGSGQAIVFLFDRFSEFAEKMPGEFFSSLRVLRTTSGGKLSVVFSTHRPLEDLLPPNRWQDFYEFFVGNHIYLLMYDKVATDFRISILEKEYGKKLQPSIKKQLVRLTGGHGKLMKLSTQILLAEGEPKKSQLIDFLLGHILIKGSLLEIWQALTREEKSILRQLADQDKQDLHSPSLTNLHLPFPLFSEFVRRNLPETLVSKTIRLDEKVNEIYFGDEPIKGLTAYEFRLLSYLISNPNRVCQRDEIIQAVWSDTKTAGGVSDEALDQMIHRARKKIEDEADNPKHVLTVKGRGFRFIP